MSSKPELFACVKNTEIFSPEVLGLFQHLTEDNRSVTHWEKGKKKIRMPGLELTKKAK